MKNRLYRYIKILKEKKIRLTQLLYIMQIIKYNIKYRAMGLDLKLQKKNDPDIFAQQNSGGPELDVILSTIEIHPTDTVLDIGSGKGGALITLSKYPFKKVDGVEIYKDICEIAKKNISKTPYKNITIYNEDAQNFDKYSDYNIFYVYNPFSGIIMENVLKKISKSLIEKPRNIILIYLNPVYHNIIIKSGIFVKYIEPKFPSLNVNIYSNNKNFNTKNHQY